MKHLLTIILLASLLQGLPLFKAYGKTEIVKLAFSEEDFNITEDKEGKISIYPAKCVGDYMLPEGGGLPCIPTLGKGLAIPADHAFDSMSFSVKKRLVRSDVKLSVAPTPLPTNEPATSQPNIRYSYNGDSYPAEICKYTGSSTWGDLRLAYFDIVPFVYDPESGDLFIIEDIEMNVNLKFTGIMPMNASIGEDFSFMEEHVLNPTYVQSLGEKSRAKAKSRIKSQSQDKGVEYLIVTGDSLVTPFTELMNWKKIKGLRCKLVTMNEIYRLYRPIHDGRDDLCLKQYICDEYNKSNRSLKYVLLGGGLETVPTFLGYGIVEAPDKPTTIDDKIPTDYFFECLEKLDWNDDSNTNSGDFQGDIHFTPSIHVTRILSSTEQEGQSYVNKLLSYEKDPKYNHNILLTGSNRAEYFIDGRNDVEVYGDSLYNNHILPFWDGTCSRFFDFYNDINPDNDLVLNHYNLSNQIAKGYSFINACFHGDYNLWYLLNSDVYAEYNCASTQINSAFSCISTEACHTNDFIFQDCLSASLINNPNSGIITYFGSSRQGWYSAGQPELGASAQYIARYYEYLFGNKESYEEKNFGAIINKVKYSFLNRYKPYHTMRWLLYSMNPIGDPETPIYTDYPETFSNVKVEQIDNRIYINSDVENCRISVTSTADYGDTFFHVVENTRETDFEVPPVPVTICITKQNYYSYVKPLTKTLIIQNKTLTGYPQYTGFAKVVIGSDVTDKKPTGEVVVKSGTTKIKSDEVVIENGFSVEKGSELIINPQ